MDSTNNQDVFAARGFWRQCWINLTMYSAYRKKHAFYYVLYPQSWGRFYEKGRVMHKIKLQMRPDCYQVEDVKYLLPPIDC
jgi:hypothetical protein